MRLSKFFFSSLAAVLLFAIAGCSSPVLELPCFDLPSTPETCAGENPDQNSLELKIDWSCADCTGVREGTAPLRFELWLANIQIDPNEPVLWEIFGLNSNSYERDFTKPTEKFIFTFKSHDTYRVQAHYKSQKIEPIEIRVDLNEISAKWSTPWRIGSMCDSRIHFLGDPEIEREVAYWIEVVVKVDGLENVSVADRVPYRVKYPEYISNWRITPQKNVKPYRFPTQLEPQVIEFDASGRRNFVWDVFVKCISPNGIEEQQITTRI